VTTPHANRDSGQSGKELLEQAFDGLEQQTPDRLTRLIRWLRDPKSRKIRIPLGILFILSSFLWFLPVLGIEFRPIGLLLIAQDVPFLRRPVAKMMLWGELKWAEQRKQLARKGAWAGYLLGFSLGGLFEAILLRHVLQWHHVLLGLQWEPLQRMWVQVLADRLFLLLMCSIALCGVWSLWRGRLASDLLAGSTLLRHALSDLEPGTSWMHSSRTGSWAFTGFGWGRRIRSSGIYSGLRSSASFLWRWVCCSVVTGGRKRRSENLFQHVAPTLERSSLARRRKQHMFHSRCHP
jgi:hypothetical protein